MKLLRPRNLASLTSLYLLACIFVFSVFLLFWVYHTTEEAIDREIETSFEQRHAIAEIIIQEKIDDIEDLLKDIQLNQALNLTLASNDHTLIRRALLDIINENDDYDLDLLFLSRLDGMVWINASSPLFNTSMIVAEINKDIIAKNPLTGVRRFRDVDVDMTTVMLGVPLVQSETGRVFGSMLGGYVLNDNFSIMESIRLQTQSDSIALFENGDYLGSTEMANSETVQHLIRARKSGHPGSVYAAGGLLISYRVTAISAGKASLEIAAAIPDHKSSLLKQSFIKNAAVTLALSFCFLLLTVFIIRRLTLPSLKNLIAYTEKMSFGNLEARYKVGYISEFNRIGGALEEMAENLNNADQKRKELEHIINLSPAVVFLWKAEEKWPVQFVSDNIRQFGYTPEEFLTAKIPYASIIHPDDLGRFMEEVDEYSNSDAEEFMQEYRIVTKTGSVRYVENRIWIRKDAQSVITHYHGIILDITQRKDADREKAELQAKLAASRKMEALGLLAGGVAHDLNNILSGILSYPELMLMNLPEDSNLRRPLKVIMDSGERAAAVVQDLLTMARGVASSRQIVKLNDIVREYLKSPEFRRIQTIYPKVTVKKTLDSELLNINCSVVHIKKALMNLVTNAFEAVDGEGEILIITENTYLDKPLPGYEDVYIGEYALLRVIDNGPGIPAKDIERIFEPFYTKKEMGRSGTGLGLAVVWNTVVDNDGFINLESQKGKTEFKLFFPICRGKEEIVPEKIPMENLMGNGETVLIVDDEQIQRDISSGMLTRLGYLTTAVPSGEQAVGYLKNHKIEIILLDMLMPPGINGLETYRRIIKLAPGQKAVIASGFSENEDIKEAQRLGAGQYLKKPYTIEKLGLAVKTVLNS